MRLRITTFAIAWILLSACGGVSAAQSFVKQHTYCNPVYYYSPRWSPDGTKIAFIINDKLGANSIFVEMIDVNSLIFTRLGVFYDLIAKPSWSPDGKNVVVSTGTRPDIFVIDASNPIQRIRIEADGNFGPEWSPDGKHLALTSGRYGYPTIVIATLPDTSTHEVTDESAYSPVINDLSDENGPIQGNNPRWSHDGNHIAYISSPDFTSIYIVEPDGTGKAEVSQIPQLSSSISWSPNSKQLAYATGSAASMSVYLINVDGSHNKFFAYGHSPDWSPDGKRIAFIGQDTNGYDELFVMNLDGSNKIQLTNNPGNGICIH